MLDAFPRRSGDHLTQNFSRKIKLIFSIILQQPKIFFLNKRSGNTVLIQITPKFGNTAHSRIFLPKRRNMVRSLPANQHRAGF
jgi:hypothetical protein